MADICHLTKRQTRRQTLFSVEQSDDNFPGSLLSDVLWFFRGALDEIPVDSRDTAQVEFDTVSDHDIDYVQITISYVRPETNDEMQKRVETEQQQQKNIEERELKLLEQLEAKYRRKN